MIEISTTIQDDLDLETLKELHHLLNAKLGWNTTPSTRVECIFGRFHIPGLYLHSVVFDYKKSDVEKVKKWLEEKNMRFSITVDETKTIYQCESKGYKSDDGL